MRKGETDWEAALQKPLLSLEEMAAMIGTSPEALAAFEKAYASVETTDSDNLFEVPAKTAIGTDHTRVIGDMYSRIVDDLAAQTDIWHYKNGSISAVSGRLLGTSDDITPDEIRALPEPERPQLTGNRMQADLNGGTAAALLFFYRGWKATGNRALYDRFRQGLDMMDLDPLSYVMLGKNPASMGQWLPALAAASDKHGFFRIPETTLVRVPLPVLQLSRIDFQTLTPATKAIVDQWAETVFELDRSRDYFVKTGIFSSKFDFRNAHIPAGKEVGELGEYLLYIAFQASQMASPLGSRCIYGAATTNEWCVREYIAPPDGTMAIYHGLPLRTEYRVFVDCDTDSVLGIHNYWDPAVMKKRFAEMRSIDDMHDAVTFRAEEKRMRTRYEENKDLVCGKVQEMLPDLALRGQWSLDVMQSGDVFWLIDMAPAERSAYYKETVPEALRRPMEEHWLPEQEDLKLPE